MSVTALTEKFAHKTRRVAILASFFFRWSHRQPYDFPPLGACSLTGAAMDKVELFFARTYTENILARSHYCDLWRQFRDAGVADRNFVSELTGGDDGRCWTRVWEMLLYRLLANAGFQVSSSPKNHGPDFVTVVEGKTSWFEAICPAPSQVPKDSLEFPELGVLHGRTPHYESITLRITSAIDAKMKKFSQYAMDERTDVKDDDPKIIAINTGRLNAMSIDNGISGLPVVVESVFPLGSWGFPVIAEEGRLGEPKHTIRSAVSKYNGSSVTTTAFLDPAYSGVSAVLACSKLEAIDGFAPIIVHNPLARTPFPVGKFPGAEEYVADWNGDVLTLRCHRG